jgi:hypothetical protein
LSRILGWAWGEESIRGSGSRAPIDISGKTLSLSLSLSLLPRDGREGILAVGEVQPCRTDKTGESHFQRKGEGRTAMDLAYP